MVGLAGVLGRTGSGSSGLRDGLLRSRRERLFEYEDSRLAVASAHHPIVVEDQPVGTSGGDALVWTWGNLFGVDAPGGYRPIEGGVEAPATAVARLYDRQGLSAIARLNGTFACLVYDQADGVAHLCTDRFGTHPLHYASHSGGGVAFSNDIQSLVRHPGVGATINIGHLCEYFTTARVAGCETPFTGVKNVPPGTILSVDLDTGRRQHCQYWRPRYRPLDRPFSYFVDRFATCFERILDERLDDHRTYGLLLSGGSDSRLVLAGAGGGAVAYHLSDWMSDEARIAERAALTNGSRFRWLQRDPEYDGRVLDEAPEIMNFYGRFDQAHTWGFHRQLQDEVDVVLSGLYADTLFRALPLPRPKVTLGPIGDVTLPTESTISSVAEFVSVKSDPVPAYLDVSLSLQDVLRDQIERRDDAIVDHGVVYPSMRELVSLCEFYPLSNDPDLFYYSLLMAGPHWTPFLDNRLVDLALRLPVKYQLRRNIVNAAISRIDPDLAAIPHAETGRPLDSPFWAHYVGQYLTSSKRNKLPGNTPPISYYSHAPWTDKAELLTSTSLVQETLEENRDLIERLPFLSWDGAVACFEGHQNGAANHEELLTLLGFLEMPVAEHLARTEPRAADEIAITEGSRG